MFSIIQTKQSLQRRLNLLIMTICGVALIFAFLVNAYWEFEAIKADLKNQLQTLVQTTAYNMTAALSFDDTESATKILSTLRADSDMVGAAVYRADASLLGSVDLSTRGNFILPEKINSNNGDKTEFIKHNNQFYLVVTQAIFLPDKNTRLGTLYAQLSINSLWVRLSDHGKISVVILISVLLLSYLLSNRMQKSISVPIIGLTENIIKISSGNNYQIRTEKSSDDEIGILIENFNLMVEKLAARETELQQYHSLLESKVKERTVELEKAKEEAERSNRAKSEFLSSMSHELRTPLNAILGFGQLLEMDEDLNEDQAESVDEILNAGDHLLHLINELLDLAKIESGKLEVMQEVVTVAEVLEDCLSLIHPLTQKKQVTLTVQPYSKQLTVLADYTRLKQAVLNLLSNAIKYNKPNGSVEVGIESLDSQWLRLSVADTGIGMTAAQIERLFQPFTRFGNQYSVEGTGIGLLITKRLIELMDGKLSVTSRHGEGSCFQIELPLAQVHTEKINGENLKLTAVQNAGSDLQNSPLIKYKVLYIEDNPANMRLLERIIAKRTDIALFTASMASLGIELAKAQHPDLILLDINLPEMDGYETIKKLRIEGFQNTPIIGVSANALPSDLEKANAAGFNNYLTKPLNFNVFLGELEKFLPAES